MQCTQCGKHDMVVQINTHAYCEACAIDEAMRLLNACRLSGNAVSTLVRTLCNVPTTDKHYTATEIAKVLGVSAQKVGRTANLHGLKSSRYGEWRLDQASHSHKQVETFHYNLQGKQRLEALIRGNHT
ncbi:hypothetical protein K6Q96_06660 [Grimontia kaedaensis]|uniref:Uncharacterized protein n=1 Tax=Grimontia kaedaensis TaxID=2872157 RepID=A0ABY4WXG2_9GAMM|nr:hypothetical protein [Grimontia kaedaensis]USH03669.1 hypothetical protein K6Q96_06660 [Grimontia kaedaensis]